MTAFLMISLMAMMAFAIDLGYVYVSSAELQRCADSAAIAAAWELIDEEVQSAPDLVDELPAARSTAISYVSYNPVCNKEPTVDSNTANAPGGDIVFGYMANLSAPSSSMDVTQLARANAVQVRVRKAADMNGEVPFFFARAMGFKSVANSAQATAVICNNSAGLRTPAGGKNLDVLPFALDETTWNAMLAGGVSDSWRRTWDSANKRWIVASGSDGIREVNLYPQGTGSPGNRGTIDIGGSNNSTADIARQIVDGITPQDLSHHGGKLEFNDAGEIYLNGDTGISAGVKDELASIIGQPRIIPVFRSVTGPGNNATYTIVQLVGVSVLEVKLTGSMSSKRVMIQPAVVVTHGVIPGDERTTSQFVYSTPYLIH